MMTQKKLFVGVGVLATLVVGAPILGEMAEHLMMAGVQGVTGERVEYVTTREADKNRSEANSFVQSHCETMRSMHRQEGVEMFEESIKGTGMECT